MREIGVGSVHEVTRAGRRSTLGRAAVLGAAFAVSALGLVACGGDDASVDPTPNGESVVTVLPNSLITADQGAALLESDPSIVLIDVRTPEEYDMGHIEGAVNIDVESSDFESQIADLPEDGHYIVYCRSGNRSAAAASAMRVAGFSDVKDMGGLQAWMAAGHPIVTP